jgi:hypothetical protein
MFTDTADPFLGGLTLFEEGSYHVDPRAMAELVRRLPSRTTPALASSLVVKPTSGLLFGFTVTSTNVAAQFIQVFDLAAVPADATVPLFAFNVAATSFVSASWLPYPRACRNGIVLCNSTTQGTKTIGAADCLFDVQYL